MQSLHSERGWIYMVGLILLIYFVIMDIILYCSLQNSTLVDPKHGGAYSPFRPLSVKLLMSDPVQHYIISPSAEYFDDITRFSKVFYFITPNMISFTHLGLSLVAAKFVSSDSLRTRRFGVIVYQFRTWLDALDGVVFRSHNNEKNLYVSHHESWGYLVDALCDIAGGVIFSFGVLFYLFKQPNSFYNKYKEDGVATLPLTKSENGFNGGEKHSSKPSKKILFWKCWCWGIQIFLSSGSWDKRVEQYGKVFAAHMPTADQQVNITSSLTSGSYTGKYYVSYALPVHMQVNITSVMHFRFIYR